MISEVEKKQQDEGKGFAALSSMLSNVDQTLGIALNQTRGEASASSSQQSSRADSSHEQERAATTAQTTQAASPPPSNLYAGMWLFAVASLIIVVWLATQPRTDSVSTSAYSEGNVSASPPPGLASRLPTQAKAPSRLTEEKPPVGQNNVLSTTQIHYCLAEKIRLDAAESAVNTSVNADVNQFNGYVSDYNRRCGEFRYRQGALESAQKDVELSRVQLQAEGRGRFVQSPPEATRSPAQVRRNSFNAGVQTVQRRLNEMGYSAGRADGFMGEVTRVAILSFQRDHGLPEDGNITPFLLEQLGNIQRKKEGESLSLPNNVPAGPNAINNSSIPTT